MSAISSSAALSSASSSLSLPGAQKVKLHNEDSTQDNQRVNAAQQATSNPVAAKAGIDISA